MTYVFLAILVAAIDVLVGTVFVANNRVIAPRHSRLIWLVTTSFLALSAYSLGGTPVMVGVVLSGWTLSVMVFSGIYAYAAEFKKEFDA